MHPQGKHNPSNIDRDAIWHVICKCCVSFQTMVIVLKPWPWNVWHGYNHLLAENERTYLLEQVIEECLGACPGQREAGWEVGSWHVYIIFYINLSSCFDSGFATAKKNKTMHCVKLFKPLIKYFVLIYHFGKINTKLRVAALVLLGRSLLATGTRL